MKKIIYKNISDWSQRLGIQLNHFASPYARAVQMSESIRNAKQIQALLLNSFKTMDSSAFLAWPPYSWMGKDGIDGWLLYLLARAGMGQKTSVDFGAATGADGNTFNLVMNHGFTGYMIDGSSDKLNYGKKVYSHMGLHPPVFISSMVTLENIEQLCIDNKLPIEPEVLSMDIDSVDWYILDAMPLQPFIIVTEFNNVWGPDESLTIPYSAGFCRELGNYLYGGASLAALYTLLVKKGYKMAGIAASGFDAIFVKNIPRFDFIQGITPSEAYALSPAWQLRHKSGLNDGVRQKPWVVV